MKNKIILILVILVISAIGATSGHLYRKEVNRKLDILTARQITILAHITCPPEMTRVYYDPSTIDEKVDRMHIEKNPILIPKKKKTWAPPFFGPIPGVEND